MTAEDVAKRLIDYGFHAPTLSFPVAGTLMVEPTESETLDELDRFIDAMIAIREEIRARRARRMAAGRQPAEERAAHRRSPDEGGLAARLLARGGRRGARRALRHAKYWPPVGRVDNVYGDRNLFCSCVPMSAYEYRPSSWSSRSPWAPRSRASSRAFPDSASASPRWRSGPGPWTRTRRSAGGVRRPGGQLLAAFTVRRGWDFRALLPFLAGGLAGLPLGLYLLPRLDVPMFKAALGLMLVVVCPLMFFASRLPRVGRPRRRRAGRRGRRCHGRPGRLHRRGAHAVVHGARLRQGPAARHHPELQPGHAGGDLRRATSPPASSSRACCRCWPWSPRR